MAKRDYTRFKVNIPKSYKPEARRAIAREIIDHVIQRTEVEHKDKKGNKFKAGYSDEYASSMKGKIAGKRKGALPDLKLTGEMLNSLELVSDRPGELVIGYKKTSNKELLGRVEGNVRGSYGKPRGNRKLARDFLGLESDARKEILSKFPRNNLDALLKQIAIAKEADEAAANLAGTTVFTTTKEGPDGEEPV